MKFAFVTCVQLGLSCIEEIYRVGGRLDLAITLHDDIAPTKSGRVYLDDFCAEHGVDLLKIRNVNDREVIEGLQAREIDWLFIIGWSQIARKEVLEAPRKGVLGMHPTLLPRGRGRAAIPWAILKGLSETGVTLFKLDEGVDTGPVVAQERIPIAPRETAATLYDKVNAAHRSLLRTVWPLLERDEVVLRPQDETAASVWPGRKPEDGEIRPEMTVAEIDSLVRAVTRPYPGAFIDKGGERLRVWKGRPALDESVPEAVFEIEGVDGTYIALDYEWEEVG